MPTRFKVGQVVWHKLYQQYGRIHKRSGVENLDGWVFYVITDGISEPAAWHEKHMRPLNKREQG